MTTILIALIALITLLTLTQATTIFWLYSIHKTIQSSKKRNQDHETVTLANTKGLMAIFTALESRMEDVMDELH